MYCTCVAYVHCGSIRLMDWLAHGLGAFLLVMFSNEGPVPGLQIYSPDSAAHLGHSCETEPRDGNGGPCPERVFIRRPWRKRTPTSSLILIKQLHGERRHMFERGGGTFSRSPCFSKDFLRETVPSKCGATEKSNEPSEDSAKGATESTDSSLVRGPRHCPCPCLPLVLPACPKHRL